MSTEDRVQRLENAFTTLVQLMRNMDERMDDAGARMGTIESDLRALTELVGEVARNQRRTDEQLRRLAEAQAQLTETQERTERQMAQMNTHTNETDARLDRLAALVERHIEDDGAHK